MGNITLHLNLDKDGKRKNGTFNQVSDFILFNNNLNGDAVRLFIFYTSQSKNYKFNQNDTMKKCNLKRYSFDKADTQLKEFGFLKVDKSKGKNQWHYTISEFGNLNQKDITNEDVQKFITKNEKVLSKNFDKLKTIIVQDISNEKKIKSIQILIDNFKDTQKVFYKECVSMVTRYDSGTKAHQQAFKGWLSQKIYQEGVTQIKGCSSASTDFHPPSKWSSLATRFKKQAPMNAEDKAQAMSEESL